MAVVNETSIVIPGSLSKSDGAIFNPKTMKVTMTFSLAGFEYNFYANQHAVTQKGIIFALSQAKDDDNRCDMVEITIKRDQVTHQIVDSEDSSI